MTLMESQLSITFHSLRVLQAGPGAIKAWVQFPKWTHSAQKVLTLHERLQVTMNDGRPGTGQCAGPYSCSKLLDMVGTMPLLPKGGKGPEFP